MKTTVTIVACFLLILATWKNGFAQSKGQTDANHGQFLDRNKQDPKVNVHPLTVFDNANTSVAELLGAIQACSLSVNVQNSLKKRLYDELYLNGTASTQQVAGTGGTGMAKSAFASKNAAMLFLLRLNDLGADLGCQSQAHLDYKDDAVKMLKECFIQVPSFPRVNSTSMSKFISRCKELVMYLQAYDLLMAARRIYLSNTTDYACYEVNELDLNAIRLRLQEFAHNIYKQCNFTEIFAKHNNIGLLAAGTVGLAGIVLHDCGHRKAKITWHPANWVSGAQWNIENILFEVAHSMSKRGGEYGFADGPHYFEYAFENLLPFFVAYDNFMPGVHTRNNIQWRWYHVFKRFDIQNYRYDPDYQHLYDWYNHIAQPNLLMPSFDNSFMETGYSKLMYLTGKKENVMYNHNQKDGAGQEPYKVGTAVEIDIAADVIASGINFTPTLQNHQSIANNESGDIVLRNTTLNPSAVKDDQMYLRLSAEKNTMVYGGGHEHADLTSFSICAGNEDLIIDPGYLNYTDKELTRQNQFHNIITVDRRFLGGVTNFDCGPSEKREPNEIFKLQKLTNDHVYSGMTADYVHTDFKREVECHMVTTGGQTYYYFVTKDAFERDFGADREYIWCINGNGNDSEGTFEQTSIPATTLCPGPNEIPIPAINDNSLVKFTHPCSERLANPGTYNMQVFVAAKNGGWIYGKELDPVKNRNSNNGSDIVCKTRDGYSEGYGVHTRFTATKETGDGKIVAVYWPYKCASAVPPMIKEEDGNKGKIVIYVGSCPVVAQTVQTAAADRIIHDPNPFHIPGVNDELIYYASSIKFSLTQDKQRYFEKDTANTDFYCASFTDGNFMYYGSDTLISNYNTKHRINAGQVLSGKHFYNATVNVPNDAGQTQVMFYLPDAEACPMMEAVTLSTGEGRGEALASRWDATTRKLVVTLPEGITQFTMQPGSIPAPLEKVRDEAKTSLHFPSPLERTGEAKPTKRGAGGESVKPKPTFHLNLLEQQLQTRSKHTYTIKSIYDQSNIDVAYSTSLIYDEVKDTNPFNYVGDTNVLRYEAADSKLAYSQSSSQTFKYCTALTNFYSASITEGDYMIYASDSLISNYNGDYKVNAGFALIGKHKYSATVNVPEGAGPTEVMFYLPDLEIGYEMIAKMEGEDMLLPSRWKDTTQKIVVMLPEGITQFTIELADPCQASCFFPPTNVTIDTLFDFNSGSTESLGHDLDIVTAFGWLKITNGSKVNICPDFTLRNQDSITLLGLWGKNYDGMAVYTEYDENGFAVDSGHRVSQRLASAKSMIIINDKSALILDPGSYTHVGANSTILVRKGGTLLVKAGAVLEIGSVEAPGEGEVIAEDGAFVCIEEGSDVHFFANEQDSADKNIFFVSMPNHPGSYAAVNSSGGGGRFTGLGLYANSACLTFCNIKTLNTLNSVYNQPFGWANINLPVASFELPDTLCVDDVLIAKGIKTLNETKYHFEVCEYNTGTQTCSGSMVLLPASAPAILDSIRLDEKLLSLAMTYNAGNTYKVKLLVQNDCGDTSSCEKIVYIADTPVVAMSLPSTACPGVGTVVADGSGSSTGKRHIWKVSEIVSSDLHEEDETDIAEANYEYWSNVSSTFAFPDFRFRGGKSYAVSLTIYDRCGILTKEDTVTIPLSVSIAASPNTMYQSGQITLTGTVANANSYLWTSTNSLNNSTTLTVLNTVTQTTTFYLQVWGANSCTDIDTLTVKVNTYANAGIDNTICLGDSFVIGTNITNLPGGWYVRWSPLLGLSDSTQIQPWAKPDATTNYTLSVFNGSNVLQETDEVLVTVHELSIPSFVYMPVDDYEFCFENHASPHFAENTYTWDWGDGTSVSHANNECHSFPNVNVDTFYVVQLLTSNTCGDSAVTDTVWIDSTGATNPPPSMPLMGMSLVKQAENITLLPNPNNGNFAISIPRNLIGQTLCIYDPQGKLVQCQQLTTETMNLKLRSNSPGIYILQVKDRQMKMVVK